MKYVIAITLTIFINQNTITDSRDQREYLTWNIGEKAWVKENLRFQDANTGDIIPSYDQYGAYYKNAQLNNVCPEGFHVPSLNEWKSFMAELPGKKNSRGGMLIPKISLQDYELQLGGMGRLDTVILSQRMGYYWTSSDTLKTYYKQPNAGLQRHLIGVHIWSSGEQDSINVEPTYMLAQSYGPIVGMNCKCIKD